jgi:hypothetical protein
LSATGIISQPDKVQPLGADSASIAYFESDLNLEELTDELPRRID